MQLNFSSALALLFKVLFSEQGRGGEGDSISPGVNLIQGFECSPDWQQALSVFFHYMNISLRNTKAWYFTAKTRPFTSTEKGSDQH